VLRRQLTALADRKTARSRSPRFVARNQISCRHGDWSRPSHAGLRIATRHRSGGGRRPGCLAGTGRRCLAAAGVVAAARLDIRMTATQARASCS
jgi:hypothetical protein